MQLPEVLPVLAAACFRPEWIFLGPEGELLVARI
jgi:hypothetical protein